MRKLKLQMHISLDGFAAGPNGESDWIFLNGKQDPDAFQFIVDLADSSDTILLGRKMTPGFITHWENVFDNQPDSPAHVLAERMVNTNKIVFSHTETSVPGRNLKVENVDLASSVQELKNQSGKDILVYGGCEFVGNLINLNLIDEYYLITNPVALGKGLPVFQGKKVLELESSIAFKNGKVINKYIPV
ncbi:deaminase [Elizabethkingia meningoseptica]|uniref:dihydrofolate reductase family protein n=1 Tax=Elizabethkingia meningoseptica TaxID=238 RepID=UPI000332BFBB|nr:dihydrofolate reductase family protein [Elizabethkingia meningoseptica]AQX03746.1 deaminase [Elizabethkingia meningoseptica]AQX45785.1 deaminase [Elizabethkingia meningoseptica]EOR29803.1 bifunctional deaminase-reductase domain-containing protein [Elizabethkingia meningoseptica ATCC 13253 = NBRC 12535]KUY15078.1 deaminase [Elizabethkingia meningoseptica]MDE5488530.1 dihydrofolate reductase family protein [Elizabethkingia meningoseptica]